jgi:predicted lipoprotein with Yx(FWY)xxD motif
LNRLDRALVWMVSNEVPAGGSPMVRIRAAALAAAGLMALTACSELNGGSAQRGADPATNQVDESRASTEVTLAAADVGRLGTVVTDQNGRTLYRFDKDKAKPPVSNCNGDCAESWPPMIVTDASTVRLADIDQGLVGTVDRADGTKQLTLNGWPLYRFAKDSRAGDAKGQGVDGAWFASTPQGKKVAVKAAPVPVSAPAPQPDTGDGY